MSFISVRRWREFQHYDPRKRQPPWIKNNTDLMANDSYLELSSHLRGVLHGIWLEYASARCHLRLNSPSPRSHNTFGTRTLSRRLNVRVTTADIESLVQAGFLDIVASAPLAEGYQDARGLLASRAPAHSQEAEAETEKERPKSEALQGQNGLPFEKLRLAIELKGLAPVSEEGAAKIDRLCSELPEGCLAKVLESVLPKRGTVGPGYIINALRSEKRELNERSVA